MDYRGIAITGFEFEECSEIVKLLLENDDFIIVSAISNDRSMKKFQSYKIKEKIDEYNKKDFFVKLFHKDYVYGILDESVKKVLKCDKVPIFLIPEWIADEFLAELSRKGFYVMSLCIYNELLLMGDSEKIAAMTLRLKELKDICTYMLENKNTDDTNSLIRCLWNLRKSGGGLSREVISKMISCGLLLKSGKEKNISNASYDLSLGDEYYYAGVIKQLDNKMPFLPIEPYDYAIVSCGEEIAMPRDVSARFDVSVSLFCQGIILSNSTQVDPGFEGKLFCLLFNTSNKTVYLKRDMHYATMEFNKLVEPTTPYHGKYEDKDSIVSYLPTDTLKGAINELKKEIEALKAESRRTQNLYLSVLALFLTVISILLVLK